MLSSKLRFVVRAICLIGLSALSACAQAPLYGSHGADSGCPRSWALVCPVDRPTLADPRAVRASGLCRCTPLL